MRSKLLVRPGVTGALCLAVGLGAAAQASATVIDYPGFASPSPPLTYQGSATTTATSDGTVLRLTSASGSESGAAYSTSPITLGSNDTFSTQFHFRFTNPGGIDPADGITFVLGKLCTGRNECSCW
jgi:hypothetical protein